MADDIFTHNAPDFGEGGYAGPAGTSIADRLRRIALLGSMVGQRVWQDPLHTMFPAIAGPTGGQNPAGRYVGPHDMAAHQMIPGYVPQQDWQNAVRQDPLAGLLGPMQKPAPKSPVVEPGY